MPHVTRVSVAILFFLIIAVALYAYDNHQDVEYLTDLEINAKIKSTENSLLNQMESLESRFTFPNSLLYDYTTTIVNVDADNGSNPYDAIIASQPSKEWRVKEWITIDSQQNDITLGIVWERESIE